MRDLHAPAAVREPGRRASRRAEPLSAKRRRSFLPQMTVTVLLFASYADALGRASLELSLPPGSTVDDALERVTSLPGADRLPARPLVAVNEVYSDREAVLRAGDRVALIPPVAGG